MKIQDIIRESPIGDIGYVGDFNRNSSFKHERDRRLITHPASVANIKKKFGNTKQNINLIFVNTPKGNRISEYGEASLDDVTKYLGAAVTETTQKIHSGNDITIIMTNNKGDQRFHMTPWIIAHRMMHAFARRGFAGSQKAYEDAANEIMRMLSYIAKLYGVMNHGESDVLYRSYNKKRDVELFMKNFFQEVGTFKSARDKKIRDWFEVINELGAQYIITGDVKFNELPRCVTSNRRRYCAQGDIEYSEAESALDSIAGYFPRKIQRMLDSYEGKIFIM